VRILIDAGLALVNFLLYAFGFLIGARLFYSGHAWPGLICAAFLVASLLTGFWSKWWAVVGPAWLGFLWGLGASKWAIHLTDTGGEYAPPMSQYVLNPSRSDVLWSFVAAAAAGVGWWISARLRSRVSRS
jgi:hypothetical protein